EESPEPGQDRKVAAIRGGLSGVDQPLSAPCRGSAFKGRRTKDEVRRTIGDQAPSHHPSTFLLRPSCTSSFVLSEATDHGQEAAAAAQGRGAPTPPPRRPRQGRGALTRPRSAGPPLGPAGVG